MTELPIQPLYPRPRPLRERLAHHTLWVCPFVAVEWCCDWAAFVLSRWALVALLQYLGTFSLLVGVFYYFAGGPNRIKQKHYQAWQVINTAQGKGGSGGRIEALTELNADGQTLVGVDVSDAFLEGIRLPHASMRRANLNGADLLGADLSHADLHVSDLVWANLRQADLEGIDLHESNLEHADLQGANLRHADLRDVNLRDADLSDADLKDVQWANANLQDADIRDVKNAPPGFIEAALKQHRNAPSP